MEHPIDFNYQARYQKLGRINAQTRNIWIVLHGYGQLSQFFIKKFAILDPTSNCIIAPEGLSRFYIQGFDGRVGATWMTKEDRLTDIHNYLNYLDSVYKKELGSIDPSVHRVTLLGFSQGTSTASRWAIQSQIHFDRLILWAGLLPHDLDIDQGRKKLEGKQVIAVYGDQDPFITADRIHQQKQLCQKLNLKPRTIVFKGEHDIDAPTLDRLRAFD